MSRVLIGCAVSVRKAASNMALRVSAELGRGTGRNTRDISFQRKGSPRSPHHGSGGERKRLPTDFIIDPNSLTSRPKGPGSHYFVVVVKSDSQKLTRLALAAQPKNPLSHMRFRIRVALSIRCVQYPYKRGVPKGIGALGDDRQWNFTRPPGPRLGLDFCPRAELTAAAVDVLPSRIAQLGQDAPAVQAARQFGGAFRRRAAEARVVDGVVGDQVHDRVLAGEQADDAVHFLRAVVDPFEQRPLILDRVAGGAGVAFAEFDQFGWVDARRLG